MHLRRAHHFARQQGWLARFALPTLRLTKRLAGPGKIGWNCHLASAAPGPLMLEEDIQMAFAPIVFKKNDINKWFGKDIEITASVYRDVKKKRGTFSFGDLTEVALGGNKKAIRHLHAALRQNYKSPWREILTSIVKTALEAKPPKHIKWFFDSPAKRQSPRRIAVSYDEHEDTFTVRLKGGFPSPWDPPA
jgi:hypothetical protein